ncbi:uncharacterized protein LOC120641426 isoform X2 [Panicum virgatum]|uniref:uncharacterized protein LOC120641426 isoform X2 n=1 Tax=Panicum virgatum TaxID=38727 RepID=UPI0019D560BA|nr:uncharacterized protein LOC120641426 isoform X2 [Panicum virgatum]
MAAVPVYSITRAEIDEFWRRKEVEAEERRLAAEKEAARIMAKTLKMEDYALFEQMMREILEGNTGDGATASMVPAATGGTEARIIGIKHWRRILNIQMHMAYDRPPSSPTGCRWTRSTYAYLNAPALSMDEMGGSKHAITHVPQERCTMFFSSTPCQPYSTAFAIF